MIRLDKENNRPILIERQQSIIVVFFSRSIQKPNKNNQDEGRKQDKALKSHNLSNSKKKTIKHIFPKELQNNESKTTLSKLKTIRQKKIDKKQNVI